MIQRIVTRLILARLIPVMLKMVTKAFRRKKPSAAAKPQATVENAPERARIDSDQDGER